MEYKGKLYGRVGECYFPLLATTSDVDEMKELLTESLARLGVLRRSMTAHPDCEEGSEFDDMTDMSQELEDKINAFLKQERI